MKTLRTFAKGLGRSRSGNAALLLALGMPVVVGGTGFAVDTAQWYLWKRELQYAADQAVIAGAWARSNADSKDDYSDRADQEFKANLDVTSGIAATPVIGLADWDGDADASVTVAVTATKKLPFSSFLTKKPTTIAVKAQAAVVPGADYFACMLAVDPSASGAFTLGGNTSGNAPCGFGALSDDPNAMTKNGNPDAWAGQLISSGGIEDTYDDNGQIIDNIKGLTDPFEGVTPPTDDTPQTYSCPSSTEAGDGKGKGKGKDKDPEPPAVYKPEPGTYGDISIGCTTEFQPGVYTITGNIDFGQNHLVTGSGVLFVITGGGSSKINSNSKVTLSGITESQLIDDYSLSAGEAKKIAGMVIFDTESTDQFKVNGTADIVLDGIVYMPNRNVTFNGTSTLTGRCMQVVAGTITLTGTNTISNFCVSDIANPLPIGKQRSSVRLVG